MVSAPNDSEIDLSVDYMVFLKKNELVHVLELLPIAKREVALGCMNEEKKVKRDILR